MDKFNKALLVGLTGLLACSGVMTSASAKSPRATVVGPVRADTSLPQARISYVDLDLTQASGEERLVRRVKGAMEVVCDTHDTRSIASRYKYCKRIAWDGAAPQVSAAVRRAKEIAATGSSSIAAVAITIVAP